MFRYIPPNSVNTVMHAGPNASAAPIGSPVAITMPIACAARHSQMTMRRKLRYRVGSGLKPTIQYTKVQNTNLDDSLGSSATSLLR